MLSRSPTTVLARETTPSPVPFFTREDLRTELQAHVSFVRGDVASLIKPLKEDIHVEFQDFGTLLQRELAVLRDNLKANNHHDCVPKSISERGAVGDIPVMTSPNGISSGLGQWAAVRETPRATSERETQPPPGFQAASHSDVMPPVPPGERENGTRASQKFQLESSMESAEVYEASPEKNNAREVVPKQIWVKTATKEEDALDDSKSEDAHFEEITTLEDCQTPKRAGGSVSKDGWTSVLPGQNPLSPVGDEETKQNGHDRSKSVVFANQFLPKQTESGTHPKPKSSSRTKAMASGTISSHKNHKRVENPALSRAGSIMSSMGRRTWLKNFQLKCLKIVSHLYFDYVVTLLIIANGIIVGVQTDVMARNLQEEPAVAFQVLEMIFGVIFTFEIAVRLFAYRCMFFIMNGKGWNIFDLTVVSLQWFEIVLELMAAGFGVDFSLLRILRLIRVIRLARALRLIGELRTIVSSIAGSMKSLFWTGVLLFMIVYVLGVGFTQVVLNKRIKFEKDGIDSPLELDKFWGNLVSSCFSLFESITGGVDWDDVARPLIENVGPEWGIVFSFFIMFTVFAMLNVVTGVFIESVMKNASIENELRTASHVASLFRSLDCDAHGEISWEDFERALQTKEMKEFFKTIDVDIANARSLFDLLDLDESGFVNGEEFVDGCLRIWAPTKGMDLRMIRRDLNKLSRAINQEQGDQSESVGKNTFRMSSEQQIHHSDYSDHIHLKQTPTITNSGSMETRIDTSPPRSPDDGRFDNQGPKASPTSSRTASKESFLLRRPSVQFDGK